MRSEKLVRWRASWPTVALTALWAGMVGCAPGQTGAERVRGVEARDGLVVAAVSCESRLREIDFNVGRIEHWARRAAEAGAELVLFPEAGITGWWASRENRAFAEPYDGPSIQRLIRLAEELDITMAVGMTELAGDKAYITHVLLDGDGIIGKHRKSALAGGEGGEAAVWDQGNDANVFEIGGVKAGIAICFESVHPETCAKLKANGAELILAPYANGTEPEELLIGKRKYTYARACENRVWYVGCDATPHNKDRSLRSGAAYVISPEGEPVALSDPDVDGEQMVVYEVPLPAGE